MMKKITVLLLTIILVFSFAACGSDSGQATAPEIEGCEVSLITDVTGIEEGTLAGEVWQSIEKYSSENNLGSEYYIPEKATRESYLSSVKTAVDNGAKLVVMAGSQFEITIYEAQKKYPEIYFMLIDGVPHSAKNVYEAKAKTIGVIFAEEEAGFLAGYAAVTDGYDKLAFLGSKSEPEIKRYGYGFVQGAAEAAKENDVKIQIKYSYAGTNEASDKVLEKASKIYEAGTQVIFACGGDIIDMVISASESSNGKVIGADFDRSYLSQNVITSAEKHFDAAVEDVIDGYADDKFIGGKAFNYAAKNKGICLEIENAKFKTFNNELYEDVLNKLKEGEYELRKDNEVKSLKKLGNDFTTIED